MDCKKIKEIYIDKLCDCDAQIRSDAFDGLLQWMEQNSAKEALSFETLQVISKGLYFCLWMQDKALLQEDLADKIVLIHDILKTTDERTTFYFSLLSIINEKILSLDKWRIDKFLMLVRRIFRHIFNSLASNNWKETISRKYINMIDTKVLNRDEEPFKNAMVAHVISIFMDEFDKALNIVPASPDYQLLWYTPFFKSLSNNKTTDYIFNAILKDVFQAIIITLEMDCCEDTDLEKTKYQIPISDICKELFNIAKSNSIKSKRRKLLYNMIENFKIAEKKYVK
uniref:Nucleolar pre-ribosomal-associated protein 2 n=1 Tax=Parastrongyloides trichosuri TaxID=131310 RepID=A0A0N4ZRX7_PARTI